ncbi:hypothetical protein PHMEG_00011160 [Phytophthora megakarya]|uniref:Uncharacterized protein n=1 Tax=Phytophthora megakarya TaxID=4795 RepID=A0A225WDL7_9STRA|nr:hypothetical protein PHMEG_00011160 [Phytophthora megakarya]
MFQQKLIVEATLNLKPNQLQKFGHPESDDQQLDEMKQTVSEVKPDNMSAEVPDDDTVNKKYDGYCGPSKGILAASKSPVNLFNYFMPKRFWRRAATQSNLYWRQSFEARHQKAEDKDAHRDASTSA